MVRRLWGWRLWGWKCTLVTLKSGAPAGVGISRTSLPTPTHLRRHAHTFHTPRAAARNLEQDLHFPAGTLQSLDAWNQLDLRLYEWGRLLLTLDAAFHTAVAGLTGHAQCVDPQPGAAGAPGKIDAALAQVRGFKG